MLEPGFYDIPKGHVATIVTHLEMMAPPEGLGAPRFPEDVSVERQVSPDLEIYRDLFRRVGGMPWLWWSRLLLSDEDLRARFDDPNTHLFYVLQDGHPEGILELSTKDPTFTEITYFGLTPKMVGTGTGRALMTKAIRDTFEAGIPRLYLHTCTLDSPQALGFYRHMGFTPFRLQLEIAPDPRLTGHLPAEAGPNTPIISG